MPYQSNRKNPSFLQKCMLTILWKQSWKERALAESKSWLYRCPHCQQDSSCWDMGNFKFNHRGNTREYLQCPHCSQAGWMIAHHPQRAPYPRK